MDWLAWRFQAHLLCPSTKEQIRPSRARFLSLLLPSLAAVICRETRARTERSGSAGFCPYPAPGSLRPSSRDRPAATLQSSLSADTSLISREAQRSGAAGKSAQRGAVYTGRKDAEASKQAAKEHRGRLQWERGSGICTTAPHRGLEAVVSGKGRREEVQSAKAKTDIIIEIK